MLCQVRHFMVVNFAVLLFEVTGTVIIFFVMCSIVNTFLSRIIHYMSTAHESVMLFFVVF